MRRFIFASFILFSSVVSLFAAVTVTISSENLTIRESFDAVQFDGVPLVGEPGKPELPLYSCAILLPPDADLSSLNITMEGLAEETLGGTYTVKPALPPSSCGGEMLWPADRNIVNGKDVAVYSSNTFFPKEYIKSVRTSKLRNYKIAHVTVHLAKYNPATKTLKQLKGGTLKATFEAEPSTRKSSYTLPESTRKKVQDLVVNYEEIASAYDNELSFTMNSKYVIMTTAEVQNASTMLNTFIQSRRDKGYTVEVVLNSEWGGTADGMRQWLQDNYQSQNIEHVLIIGCPHATGGDVPMIRIPNFGEAATDFFFAELTGDINDTSDAGDYTAEVDVGRIPYYNDEYWLVDTVLARTLNYENEINIDWRKNALLISAPVSSSYDEGHLFETMKTYIYNPTGWSTYRIYCDNYSSPDISFGEEADVENAWNNNQYGIIKYWAHGNEGMIFLYDDESTHPQKIGAAYLRNIETDYNPIVLMGACKQALLRATTNVSMRILKTGPVSLITPTETILYSHQYAYVTGISVQGILFDLSMALTRDSLSVSKALYSVMANRNQYTYGWWRNARVFQVYGVPDVSVYSYDAPTAVNSPNISLNKDLDITFYNNRFYLNVPNNGKEVSVTLFNLQGKSVAALKNKTMKKGVHTISLNTLFAGRQNPAAGLYLCRMRVDGISKTINVILK